MARRSDGLRTQKRILSSCAKLFLEHGYHNTTMQMIYEDAHVSASSFQNLFGNKSGVLAELTRYMYDSQLDISEGQLGESLPPVYQYALETSLQLKLTELNENIRECYLEAYTFGETLDYIEHATSKKMFKTFGSYNPDLSEDDFYVLVFGAEGMMYGYMENLGKSEVAFEKKLRSLIVFTLRGYRVPEDEIERIMAFIEEQDIHGIAMKTMDRLFHQLAAHYDFSIEDISLAESE